MVKTMVSGSDFPNKTNPWFGIFQEALDTAPLAFEGSQELPSVHDKRWIAAVPSGNLTVRYWKWPFIVYFPIENGDFP